jgi:hypothetical protein
MSIFSGGGKSSGPTRLNDLAVQTSSLGLTLTKGWGQSRIKANLLWYGDFKSVGKTQKQGGKGGVKTTTYSYFASVILGLCEGPIVSVPILYRDKEVTTPTAAGMGIATGAIGQSPWSFMTTNHPTEALGYSGIAYAYVSNYGLSDSATLGNHSFEVKFTSGVSPSTDENPAVILNDIFYNTNCPIPGWGASLLGSLTDYGNYCLAAGLLLSPVLESQQKAGEFIESQIMAATNSDIFWSEGVLKVKPRGDKQITGNSVTWTPDLTPIYDLNEDDFMGDEDPVIQEIIDQSDAYNKVQVEYLDRTNQYNAAIESAQDLSNIIEFGARKEDPVEIHSICDKVVANKVANLRLQQKLYIREHYKFKLSDQYVLLEQGDYVTLTTTSDKLLLDRLPVRILEIEEDEDGNYDILAEAVTFNTASAALYNTHTSFGYIADEGVGPGNVTSPVIMNAPIELTNGQPEVWVAAGSTSTTWGGCEVWMSYDNVNYTFQGLIDQPCRYGTFTTGLADFTDPDNSNTPIADMTACRGQLLGVATTGERDAGANLILVDDEVISFKNATLTAPFTYTLSSLRRGLYNSMHAVHSSGSKFLRLDDNILRLDYTKLGFGKTVYFKFLSFNLWGKAPQSLADVSPVSFYSLPKLDRYVDDNIIYDPFNYVNPGEAEARWITLPYATLQNATIFSIATDPGSPGGTSLRIGNSGGPDDYQNIASRSVMPYAPEDIYEIRWKVEIEAGAPANKLIYLGVAAEDINGNNLTSDAGSFCYVAVSGAAESTTSGQREFVGYFSGTANVASGNTVGYPAPSIDAPSPLPTGTVRIRPLGLINYRTSGTQTGAFVKIREMTCRKLVDITARWLGDYNSSITYRLNDGVRSAQNRLFISRQNNNINHTPPTTATSDTWWRFYQDAPAAGAPGSSAKNLDLDPTAQAFRYDKTGTIIAQTIRINIRPQNLSVTTGIIRAYRLNADGSETQLDVSNHISTSGNGFVDNSPDANSYVQNLDFVTFAHTFFPSAIGSGIGVIVEVVADGFTTRETIGRSNDGADGVRYVETTVYKRSNAGLPATPSGGSFDFATGVLTAPSTWSTTVPSGTDPCYVAKGIATSPTATAATPSWIGVGRAFGDGSPGLDGSDGNAVDVVFLRSVSQPSTPAPSLGTPSGWYSDTNSVPAGAGSVWSSFGQRPDTTTNYTWMTPKKIEGTDGINAITVSPAYAVNVAAFSNGNIKSGQLPAVFSTRSFIGSTEITTLATYTLGTPTNCSVIDLGNGSFSLQGLSAEDGEITITITYAGASISQTWKFHKNKDGSSATQASATVTSMTGSTTLVQVQSVDLAVNAGVAIGGNFFASYKTNLPDSSPASYQAQGKLTIQNITDGGAEVDLSSLTTGTLAQNFPSDNSHNDGDISITGATTNPASVVKTFRVRLYLRKSAGTATAGVINNGPAILQVTGG